MTWLRDEQGFTGEARLIWSADMRYRGQSYEIETIIDRADIAEGRIAPIADAFHREHARVYDHADSDAEVMVVNLRLVISGNAPKPDLTEDAVNDVPATPAGETPVFLDGARHDATVFRRADLAPGHHFNGPAIVTQDDCTTVVPPGLAVRVDGWGNLLIEAEA